MRKTNREERAMVKIAAALVAGLILAHGAPAADAAPKERSYEAQVIRVIDGDTLKVNARVGVLAELYEVFSVRLRGIDAPEIKGKCAREKALANRAKEFAVSVVTPRVTLSEIEPNIYNGRVDARVTLATGEDLAGLILAAGHAVRSTVRRYDRWCEE